MQKTFTNLLQFSKTMMNLYDEKDDSLNRLFRDKQQELNSEMPPQSVWDKIEARLDSSQPQSIPTNKFLQFTRQYSVAASLVLGFLSVGLVWKMFSNANQNYLESQRNQNLADNISATSTETLPINQKEAEAIYKKADIVQELNLKNIESQNPTTTTAMDKIQTLPTELSINNNKQNSAKTEIGRAHV